jgi:hypothetical protein
MSQTFKTPSEIKDGKVICPSCNTKFPVLQHRSYGAAIAKKWNTVPKFHRKFLSWWYQYQLSNVNRKEWYSKVEIHDIFCKETGNTINLNNFGDRLSGIKGMKYQVLEVNKGLRRAKNNVSADEYHLNIKKMPLLIQNEWNIVNTEKEYHDL